METNTFKPCYTNFDIRANCQMLDSLFYPVRNVNAVKLQFFVDKQTPKYV